MNKSKTIQLTTAASHGWRVVRGSRGIFCEMHLQPVHAREKYPKRRKAIREAVQESLRA